MLIAGIAWLPMAAAGQDGLSMSGDQAMDVAARLIAKGQLDEADDILRTLSAGDPRLIDTIRLDVLAAEIAAARGAHDRAVSILANVLDHDPSLATVRLHLANSLFALRQDRRAEHHLKLARPDLSEDEARRATRLLSAIERRRVLSLRFSAALVPDSNVNTATDESTQVIGGIEQTLNDDGALARSGVGLSTSVTATALPRLRGPLHAEVRVRGALSDQSNIDFDFASAGAEGGLQWRGRRVNVSLLGTAGRQWFAGARYGQSYGASLRLSAPLARRTYVGVEASVQAEDYERDALDGPTYGVSVSARRAVGEATLLGAAVAVERHDAAEDSQSYTRLSGGLSVTREVVGGVTITAAPNGHLREADGYSAALGATRRDVGYGATVSVTKRDLSLHGLAPLLSYGYTVNDSNIGLYDYDRHRVNLGFTRAF